MHQHILYLGRNQNNTAELRTFLCAENNARPLDGNNQADGSMDNLPLDSVLFEVLASQKAVMRRLNDVLPTVIMVETSNKPESRLRFCKLLRERVPSAAIVAIGASILPYRFAFNGTLRTPLNQSAVHNLILNLQATMNDAVRTRGRIVLNLSTRRVSTPCGVKELTPKECALLLLLMENEGRIVPRADIIHRVWETSYMDDTRTLDVHIRWLRKKIELDPSEPVYIHTERGRGYKFTVPEGERNISDQ